MSVAIEHDAGRNGANSNSKSQAEKIDAVFEKLLDQRDRLRTSRNGAADPHDPRDHLRDVVDLLYSLVRSVDRYLRAKAAEPVAAPLNNTSDFVRAMLLAEKGSRFEPCILQGIREYRIAYDNVRRYVDAGLPEPFKADVLARFRQQLDSADQVLRLLEVELFEPKPGNKVDPRRHRVVKTAHCDCADKAETVLGVISPGFEWSDDQGNRPVHPADIIAYGQFVRPAVAPTSAEPKSDRRPAAETQSRRSAAATDGAVKNLFGKRPKGGT